MEKKLLEKFKKGKCTPEEIRKILLWYQSEASKASYSVEIDKLWDEENQVPFPDKEGVFDLIKGEIKKSEGHKTTLNKSPYTNTVTRDRKPTTFYWLKVAAAITILMITSFSLIFFMDNLFQKEKPVEVVNTITREISLGQKYSMKLPDGTLVKLNSGSRISYPEKFSDTARVIEFEGEAFFEITKDQSRPFTIKSGNINTTVLGTSFNLKSMAESERFEVSVVSGSVKVSHIREGHSIDERYLTPNQAAVFDTVNKTFDVQDFDLDKVLAWVDGEIEFENASLKDIVNTLERWYGVEIDTSQLNNRIAKGYTGSYKDKSLESVLDGISYVLDFEYEIKGKTVIIK